MHVIYLGVKADWSDTFFWKDRPELNTGVEIRLGDVWTKLLDMCKTSEGLRKAWKVPIHMPTIVSTIMKDNRLDLTHMFDYMKKLHILKPDFFTTIEVPIYDGDVKDLLKRRFQDYCYQLIRFKQNFKTDKVIVLLPGRTGEETLQCVQFAYDLGYRRFGLACADPLQREQTSYKSQIHRDIKIIKPYATKTYLFGITSPRHIEEFSYADYIITRGWYHTTMKFKQNLTLNGSVPAAVQPIIKPGQQIMSEGTFIHPHNLQELENNRMKVLKQNAFKGIDVLFSKLQSIRKQQSLEVYQKWQEKVEADSEQTIAPQVTQGQVESKETHA